MSKDIDFDNVERFRVVRTFPNDTVDAVLASDYDALLAAFKATRWISVEERLPEEIGNAYLACYWLERASPIMAADRPGAVYAYQLFYLREGWSFGELPKDNSGCSNLLSSSGLTVTHWQPIPLPPARAELHPTANAT